MASKIAFVETTEQLLAVPPDFKVVALRPLLDLEGMKSGTEFRRPDQYVSQTVLEQQGARNFSRVLELARLLDETFGAPFSQDSVIPRPAYWHLFHLKVLYDAITIKGHIASEIIKQENASEVLYFRQQRKLGFTGSISEAESVYGDVLSCMIPQLGIKGHCLPFGESGKRFNRVIRSLHNSELALRNWYMARRVRSKEAFNKRVLLLDFSYSLSLIAKELSKYGLGFDLWSNHRILNWRSLSGLRGRKQKLRDTFELASAEESIRSLLVWQQFDLWPAATKYLQRIVNFGFAQTLQEFDLARVALAEMQPSAILTSVASYAPERAVCDAARELKIPTIVSRHGEFGMRDVPIVAFEDIAVVDQALCWGHSEARATAAYSSGRVQTTVVGCPMVEHSLQIAADRTRIRKQLRVSEDDLVALYVPTGLSGNDWYASRRSPIDTAYFRDQIETVQALLAIDGLRILIKEHPGIHSSPIETWCSAFSPSDRLSVCRDDFADLIHLGDLVVLDLPSTTMVYALAGSANIYLVDDPILKWQPGIREHLIEHGVTFISRSQLCAQLLRDRSEGKIAKPRSYDERALLPFARPSVESAAHRAAKAIADTVERS